MPYETLPIEVEESIEGNFGRVSARMNPQELCSSLHGFVKMQANWELNVSTKLKGHILRSILYLQRTENLCLACTIYSLGNMHANWGTLMPVFKETFAQASEGITLRDQEMSNTLYGLCLMQATWVSIGEKFRDSLMRDLSRRNVFDDDIPQVECDRIEYFVYGVVDYCPPYSQHITNSIWALAKMDAPWSMMPAQLLEDALCRCSSQFTTQVGDFKLFWKNKKHLRCNVMFYLGAIKCNLRPNHIGCIVEYHSR